MKSVGAVRAVQSIVLAALLSAAAAPLAAQEPHFILLGEQVLDARVSAVRPQGVVTLVAGGRTVELRLADLRLPPADSELGLAAGKLLGRRLLGRKVEARVRGAGAAGEPWTGHLVVGGSDVRLELASRGLARYCPGSLREPALEAAEEAARSARRGIWGRPPAGVEPGC